MRFLILTLTIFIGFSVSAQSKKQLISQVEKLKKENSELKAQVDELKKPKVIELNDTISKVSYSIGTFVGANLKGQGGDSLQVEALNAGLKDIFEGAKVRIDQAEGMAIVQSYMTQAMMAKSERAKADNLAFLEKNKTAEGIKITASGLQYKINATGKGKTPQATDSVTVHYTGKLIDGTVIDSSVEKNRPLTIGVSDLMTGWTEALLMMHEGDKWTLFIPYNLGYGEQGAGEQIPPFATLIFDVELLKVH
jgi:FKBP-type peptidyl-prolyl cis-trans isomerase